MHLEYASKSEVIASANLPPPMFIRQQANYLQVNEKVSEVGRL